MLVGGKPALRALPPLPTDKLQVKSLVKSGKGKARRAPLLGLKPTFYTQFSGTLRGHRLIYVKEEGVWKVTNNKLVFK